MIPIGVMTHKRLRTLDTTLFSIKKTTKAPIVIFQDGQGPKEKLDYLNGKEVSLGENFPNDDEFVKRVGWLENRDKGCSHEEYLTSGIIGVGHSKMLVWELRTLFEKFPEAEAVIHCEDDVIFKEGWYEKLLEIGKSRNDWGIICPCTMSDDWKLGDGVFDIEKNPQGCFIRSQVWLVSRRVYEAGLLEKYPENFRQEGDIYLTTSCKAKGLKTILVRPALAQHIGFKSECHPTNYVGAQASLRMVDLSARKPFVANYAKLKSGLLEMKEFEKVFKEMQGKKVGYVVNPGNVGDALINSATLQCFDYFGINYVTLVDVRKPIEGIDLYVYGGGGSLGGMYQSIRNRQDELFRLGLPTIVLPQSYNDKGQMIPKHVKVWAREQKSFELLKAKGVNVDYAPDLSLCFCHNYVLPKEQFEEGVFLQPFCDPTKLCNSVDEYFGLAARFKRIVTNRVHFAITGLLLGKEVILTTTNEYHKHESMFEELKGFGCKWGNF